MERVSFNCGKLERLARTLCVDIKLVVENSPRELASYWS